MENMKIYDFVRSVPDNAQKTIGAGRLKGMTDINPMWRIQKLTEIFGPCGIGWWYRILNERLEPGAGGEVAAFVDIELYYRQGGEVSQPIPGTGGSMMVANEKAGPHTSDECFKMALTDAISVACKALGFGADVYWATGRTKYTATPGEPPAGKGPEPQKCEQCGKVITPYLGTNGKEVGVRKHVAASKMQFQGHVFCVDCIKAMMNNENPD